ncbi:unnamed protein product, partial [Laminaria digitata]
DSTADTPNSVTMAAIKMASAKPGFRENFKKRLNATGGVHCRKRMNGPSARPLSHPKVQRVGATRRRSALIKARFPTKTERAPVDTVLGRGGSVDTALSRGGGGGGGGGSGVSGGMDGGSGSIGGGGSGGMGGGSGIITGLRLGADSKII